MAGCRDCPCSPEAEVGRSRSRREGQLSGPIAKANNRPSPVTREGLLSGFPICSAATVGGRPRCRADHAGHVVAKPRRLPRTDWHHLLLVQDMAAREGRSSDRRHAPRQRDGCAALSFKRQHFALIGFAALNRAGVPPSWPADPMRQGTWPAARLAGCSSAPRGQPSR